MELTVDVTLVKKPFHIFLLEEEMQSLALLHLLFFWCSLEKGDIYIKRLALRGPLAALILICVKFIPTALHLRIELSFHLRFKCESFWWKPISISSRYADTHSLIHLQCCPGTKVENFFFAQERLQQKF